MHPLLSPLSAIRAALCLVALLVSSCTVGPGRLPRPGDRAPAPPDVERRAPAPYDPAATPLTGPVRRADDLVHSIGVNTHFGYRRSPYVTDDDAVIRLLGASGIRYIRDAAEGGRSLQASILRLYEAYGIRTLFIVDSRVSGRPRLLDHSAVDRVVARVASVYGDAALGVEGPNEYDQLIGAYDTPAAWAADLAAFQRALYRAANDVAVLRDRPVVAPSMARTNYYTTLGDLSEWYDVGNWHGYTGGVAPGEANVPGSHAFLSDYFQGRPIYVTETGFFTLPDIATGHFGVTEEAQAKYTLRLLVENFRLGFAKTFLYEFVDERQRTGMQAHFGIVRGDLTPKPALLAVQNLIAILNDPGGATFQPRLLDYRLTGASADVRQLLLQKRDGTYYLMLWQEVPSYTPAAMRNLAVAPERVSVVVEGDPGTVAVFDPLRSAEPLSRNDLRNIEVPDHPIVIRIGL